MTSMLAGKLLEPYCPVTPTQLPWCCMRQVVWKGVFEEVTGTIVPDILDVRRPVPSVPCS